MQLDEMCLVMCGTWVCGSDRKWELVVDKKKMAGMIPVHEGISIKETERRMVAEADFCIALGYWPLDSMELETGIKNPPVSLTNDDAMKYFFTHTKISGSMNLFATFKSLKREVCNMVVVMMWDLKQL